MLRKSVEQKIHEKGDRILSMKENMEALSWSRVMDIAKTIQTKELSTKERQDLAQEIISIARANVSLSARLNIDTRNPFASLIPSGPAFGRDQVERTEETAAAQSPVEPDPIVVLDSKTVATTGENALHGLPVESESVVVSESRSELKQEDCPAQPAADDASKKSRKKSKKKPR